MKTRITIISLLFSVFVVLNSGCGLQETIDSDVNDPNRMAEEILQEQAERGDMEEGDMSVFQPQVVEEVPPTPTPIPTATPVPTPTPEPTPTPDPSAPTVEKAEQKILELQTAQRLQESKIAQMVSAIQREESAIRSDYDTLERKYQEAIRKAEANATETRYKTVKRKDYYGRERKVQVPYEHENLGAKSQITNINNIYNREKRVLTARHQEVSRQKDQLSQAQLQLDHTKAHIAHLRKWIEMNGE